MWRIIDLVYDEAYSSLKKPDILYAAAVYRETEERIPPYLYHSARIYKNVLSISLSSCSLPQAQYLEAWRNQSICEPHYDQKLNIKTSDDYFVYFIYVAISLPHGETLVKKPCKTFKIHGVSASKQLAIRKPPHNFPRAK